MRSFHAILLCIAFVAIPGLLKAQTLSPLGFSYQAVARDANGSLIQNSTVNLEFEIYRGQVTGNPIYTETFSNINTNNFGLVNLVIGKGNAQFGAIDWGAGSHSVLVKLNNAVVDITEFGSVPYSEVSRKATEMQLSDINDVRALSPFPNDIIKWNGTDWVSSSLSVDDADADPFNEIQSLSFTGRDLSISNGNTVSIPDSVIDDDADSSNELQSLSLMGRDLSISNGNTVSIPDSVIDDDADSSNELQALSLINHSLSISGITGAGSSADLSPYVSPWSESNGNLYRSIGNVGIGTAMPDAALDVWGDIQLQGNFPSLEGLDPNGNLLYALFKDSDGGRQDIFDVNGNLRVLTGILPDGDGSINLFGANSSLNMTINSYTGFPNAGVISMRDPSGADRAQLGILSIENAGTLALTGGNGNLNTLLNIFGGAPDGGVLGMFDSNGASRLILGISDVTSGGFMDYSGPNGQLNGIIGNLAGRDNNGFIGVYDSLGAIQAGMYVDVSGNGVLFKDVNSFRMDHPVQAGKEIWYAAIEGPEAAAYERGTASLVNGETFVSFSDHFEWVINPDEYTVHLTPLDANSEGLAVIEKSAKGFRVKEMHGGKGNYSFDWMVQGVRKGYEDFRVIRDASELKATMPRGKMVDNRNLLHSHSKKE